MDIATYREKRGLKLDELAEQLHCSKGHASDLCNGKVPVSVKIAHRMAELTGKPWHKFMEPQASSGASA